MATWWFDLVRFADTVGYHGDQDHRITPYRDYVIKSFNDNLPFDQFTIEQLAGDLVAEPDDVATRGHRLQPRAANDARRRQRRTASIERFIWPIACEIFPKPGWPARWAAASATITSSTRTTQDDFYSMQAFFADVDAYGSFQAVGSNDLPTQRPPEMLAWTLPVYEKCKALDEKIAKLEESLTGLLKKDWEKNRERTDRAQEGAGRSRSRVRADDDHEGCAAARVSHSAAGQLDGQFGQRSFSRTRPTL